MRRVIQSLLIATLLGTTLAGCVVAPVHPRRPPPPPIVEVIPVAPAPSYHWVAGHYSWHAGQWLWTPGHWRY